MREVCVFGACGPRHPSPSPAHRGAKRMSAQYISAPPFMQSRLLGLRVLSSVHSPSHRSFVDICAFRAPISFAAASSSPAFTARRFLSLRSKRMIRKGREQTCNSQFSLTSFFDPPQHLRRGHGRRTFLHRSCLWLLWLRRALCTKKAAARVGMALPRWNPA
jgi:hypothetical protein